MQIGKELINSCIKQNREAQFELYELCFGVLMSVCMRYMKNEEDARAQVNYGFLKILSNLDKYKLAIPFEAWIRRIMINAIIDDYRKQKRYKNNTSLPGEDQVLDWANNHTVLNEGEASIIVEDIYKLIRKLPPVTGQVFNLYVIDGYKHQEIAKLLDMKEGTSKWHLSEARRKLRAMILKELEEEAELTWAKSLI